MHICCDSNIDAFLFDEQVESTTAYYPVKVDWLLLPSLKIEEKKSYIRDLEKLISGDSHPVSWVEELQPIWKEIAKHECIEYLQYQAELRDMKLDKVGEKTNTIFESLLENYSIGQIFNLTFQSAMSSSDYAIRENIPKYRAKNMLIGNIQRKADKARAEGWVVKNSRRDFKCPQTIISSMFFDTFMKIGKSALEVTMPKIKD